MLCKIGISFPLLLQYATANVEAQALQVCCLTWCRPEVSASHSYSHRVSSAVFPQEAPGRTCALALSSFRGLPPSLAPAPSRTPEQRCGISVPFSRSHTSLFRMHMGVSGNIYITESTVFITFRSTVCCVKYPHTVLPVSPLSSEVFLQPRQKLHSSSTSKAPCDYTGSAGIIQNNLLILMLADYHG